MRRLPGFEPKAVSSLGSAASVPASAPIVSIAAANTQRRFLLNAKVCSRQVATMDTRLPGGVPASNSRMRRLPL